MLVRLKYQWIDSTLQQPTRSGDSAVRGSLYFGRVVAPFHAAGVDASCISRSRVPTGRTQNWQCSLSGCCPESRSGAGIQANQLVRGSSLCPRIAFESLPPMSWRDCGRIGCGCDFPGQSALRRVWNSYVLMRTSTSTRAERTTVPNIQRLRLVPSSRGAGHASSIRILCPTRRF